MAIILQEQHLSILKRNQREVGLSIKDDIIKSVQEWREPLGPMGNWPKTDEMRSLARRIGPDAASVLARLFDVYADVLESEMSSLVEFAVVYATEHPDTTLVAFSDLVRLKKNSNSIEVVAATGSSDAVTLLSDMLAEPGNREEFLIDVFDGLAVLGTAAAKETINLYDPCRLSHKARKEYDIARAALGLDQ